MSSIILFSVLLPGLNTSARKRYNYVSGYSPRKSCFQMYDMLYNDFLSSTDTLRVYSGENMIFSSEKDGLLPLVEYLDIPDRPENVVIMDRVTGNAAALLSVLAGCTEIYSPLGSEIATGTLDKYTIPYHFEETVPYIQRPNSEEMCPMEKLSLNKEPEEFYQAFLEMRK